MEKYTVGTSSQINKIYLPSSATASSFATYGQFSVNKFTGTPSIAIPLYDLSYKDLSVSLDLSYQKGNGVKPGDFPGFVGNGWLLSSGGVISRKSKGISPIAFPNPQTVPTAVNLTEDDNWSSNASMLTNIQNPNYPISQSCTYDEFSFSFGGLSGTFYKDYNGVMHFKSNQGEDLKIEMTVMDNAQKEIQAPLEDQETNAPAGSPSVSTVYNNGKIILYQNPYSFVITDSRGIKYTFGGTDESIEFSRPGYSINNFPNSTHVVNPDIEPISWYLTSVKSPNGYQVDYVYERGKFYLTSTSSVSGLFTNFTNDLPPFGNTQSGTPTAKLINSSLINPCYLKQIITPQATVQFYRSVANQQLGYQFRPTSTGIVVDFDSNWHPDADYCNIYFNGYKDVRNAQNVYDRFPDKLDYFTISNASGLIKTISFEYTQSTTTRLKLTSVKIKGSDNNVATAQVYTLGYNNLTLPPYLSFQTDAYGFYNGTNTYITSNNPTDYRTNFTSLTWRQSYLASRLPNETNIQAEILTKVTYPTGGFTDYEYENNRYGRTVQSWPSSIVENTNATELLTAGLRIKKIINYDFEGHIATQKSYFYKKNYASGSQISSGSLNYVPLFFEEFNGHIGAPYNITRRNSANDNLQYSGNMYYLNYSTNPINPINYNKSGFISYSEISEVDLDGRHIDTEFKNYDNGYGDRPALNAIYDHQQVSSIWKEDSESSMDFERGQVLTETIYDNANTKKQQTTYAYNDDPNRFNDNGINQRIIKCYPNPIMVPYYAISLRYLATLAYGYYPYLKLKTTESYENGQIIRTELNYQYNSSRLLTEQSATDSKGKTIKIIIKYPVDFTNITSSEPISAGIQNLKSLHIISSPIEQSSYISNTQDKLIGSLFTTYKTTPPLPDEQYAIEEDIAAGGFSPSNVQSGIITKDSRYHVQGKLDLYDANGNVLQRTKANGPPEVYLWGYGRSHLIAVITNADYTTVAQVLNTTGDLNTFLNQANPDVYTVNTYLTSLRTDQRLKDAQITTYTYTPLVGMSSQTDTRGRTSYFEYDEQQRLKYVKDNDGNIIKSYCYNYAGQQVDCGFKPVVTSFSARYAASRFIHCSTGPSAGPFQFLDIYSTSGFRFITDRVIGAHPEEVIYYLDEQLTTLVPDGYYSLYETDPHHFGYRFYYLEDGKVVFSNFCDQTDPGF